MPIMQTVIQGGGTTPSGTKPITTNGIHDVAGYASADVQVPTTAPAHYIEKTVDANGKLINSASISDLTGVTDVGQMIFAYQYKDVSFPINTNIIFDSLLTLSGESAFWRAFQNCTGITSVDLSSLITVSGGNTCNYMFSNCQSIVSINLSSLTTISGNSGCNSMFEYCKGLTSVDLSSLTTISNTSACQGMFNSCTGLTSVDLSKLTSITGSKACQSMFANCSLLTSLSFPALKSSSFGSYTNQFSYLVSGITGCTIHFPSNLDPQGGSTVISSLSGYPNFGGTNTVLAFDLPATE